MTQSKETELMSIKLKLTTDVPLKRISSLLCCAFEGGSNYWYSMLCRGRKPTVDAPTHAPEDKDFYHIWWPLYGGTLKFVDAEEDKSHELTHAKIIKGLHVMAAKYPRHWADFINENDDADTGDVFLQCCVFGECIYG